MSDEELRIAFEACTLPKADWTHEAHVRMAWIYLSTRSYEEALESIRAGIQKYNLSLGNTSGYHDTITVAFARLIKSSILQSPGDNFPGFHARCPGLFRKSPSPLAPYYSKERLASADAVSSFVEPDLSPLP
ncbi:MAG: hypothetical protein U0798_06700 [Gemmataceae bacterium]